MDLKLRTKWVEELRGTRYTQAQLLLREGQGHCCLGVLCDIVDPGAWKMREGVWYWYLGDEPYESTTPARLLKVHYARTLANMNDRGDSFTEIAEWIETNIPVEG